MPRPRSLSSDLKMSSASLASLDNLTATGVLKPEPCTQEDFDDLLQRGRVKLADARRTALAFESRFDLAYNAARALSLAALRWHGYRPANRYAVFQTLPHTLGLPAPQWRVLAKAHGLRNSAEYEGGLEEDEQLLEEMLSAAEAVADAA